MNLESLKELIGGLDPESLLQKILPQLEPLLGKTAVLARLMLLIGPFLILAMGLYYFLNAPKEANYRSGFRCVFGMGSVEAWRFTQRLAGCVWSLLGLALVIWMSVAGLGLVDLPLMDAMLRMMGYIFWQAILLLISRLAIGLVAFLRYDRKGNRRYTWSELWRG